MIKLQKIFKGVSQKLKLFVGFFARCRDICKRSRKRVGRVCKNHVRATLFLSFSSVSLAFGIGFYLSNSSFINTTLIAQPDLEIIRTGSTNEYGENVITLKSAKSTNPKMVLRVGYGTSFVEPDTLRYMPNRLDIPGDNYPSAITSRVGDNVFAYGAIKNGVPITNIFKAENRIDGWWYYNYVIEPGDEITLLSEINLKEEAIDMGYGGYDAKLYLYYEVMEAVQGATEDLWGRESVIDFASGRVNWENPSGTTACQAGQSPLYDNCWHTVGWTIP